MATTTWGRPKGTLRPDHGLLVTGVTLVAFGGILGLTGLSMGIIAMARLKVAQARAATTAGSTAWRDARLVPRVPAGA